MLNKKWLLPPVIDNTFRGRKIALWFFYAITLLTLVRSLVHIIANDGGAQSIATIPLNGYPHNAAATVILIFSYWGISQLIIGLLYILVAFKYRSLVPLMYLLLFIEYALRLLLGHLKPIHTTGTAPGLIANYVMIALSLFLFLLSAQHTQRNNHTYIYNNGKKQK